MSAYLQTKLEEMEKEVRELKRKSIELGESGDVDAAHASTTQAETLEARLLSFCLVFVRSSPCIKWKLHAVSSLMRSHSSHTNQLVLQEEMKTFQTDAKQRAQDNLNRYGEQEVCQYSGVIINSEESRLRDHKSGKNYRQASLPNA